MIKFFLGLLLTGLFVSAQAAQLDEEYFSTKLDLLTTRLVHSDTDLFPTLQFGASVVFTHVIDATPTGSGFGSTYLSPSLTNMQSEIGQLTNANWQPVNVSDRIYLARHFRVDFNDQQLNITVKSHSALIEYEGLKINLGSHLSTIVWNKEL